MIRENTLRQGLYMAFAAVVLVFTGIITAFEQRAVIDKGITLSTVMLLGLLIGVGYMTARQSKKPTTAGRAANGVVGSLIVGLVLAVLIFIQDKVDLTFVFPNMKPLLGGTLTFGQTDLGFGLETLLAASLILGAVGGLLTSVNARLRQVLVFGLMLTVVLGLLEAQLNQIILLQDAIALAVAFALGYGAAFALRSSSLLIRLIAGLVPGLIVGTIAAALGAQGSFAALTQSQLNGLPPIILLQSAPMLIAVFAVTGIFGALAVTASKSVHNGAVFFVIALVVLGVLHQQGAMTVTAAVTSFVILSIAQWLVPARDADVTAHYESLGRGQQRGVVRLAALIGVVILLIAPLFLGQYITDVLNLVGLYVIMGIGLNIVVGNAGLLDLGYVAFFAIGAYSIGLLTTPSLLTCGGIPAAQIKPDQVATVCKGLMTFWEAWPICIGLSALAGILLGIPVLRLRGDYLAIVTLGFGEIIRIIVKFDDFKPLFGAAQGIANIPRPTVDLRAFNPAWQFQLTGANGIYYLVLVGILITAYVATRLSSSKLGRSWRAMRADEDVAQAMGVNLIRTKLLAFAIGAAFAGMGGAVAGSRLFGAYPDSYTLQVSINVLSLIIIGGLGSIPGVIIGAFVLIGLPEALRELSDFRLLAFGALLVGMMLIRPEGLIPPSIRKLAEEYAERHTRQGARP
jgi:branched-chain amino acid transport system permease protein